MDVVQHRGGEDHRVLRHHGDPPPDVFRTRAAHVDAVDHHPPRLRVVEALQQLEYRRLAGSRRTDQRQALARGHVQRQAVERRRVRSRRVVEPDLLEPDGTHRRRGQRHRVARWRHRRLGREQLEQAAGRPGRPLQVAQHLGQRAHRAGDDHRVEDERRERARRQPAGHHVAPADPEDDADRAEDEQDRTRCRAVANTASTRAAKRSRSTSSWP